MPMYQVVVLVDGVAYYVGTNANGCYCMTQNYIEMNRDNASLAEEWAAEKHMAAFVHQVS